MTMRLVRGPESRPLLFPDRGLSTSVTASVQSPAGGALCSHAGAGHIAWLDQSSAWLLEGLCQTLDWELAE